MKTKVDVAKGGSLREKILLVVSFLGLVAIIWQASNYLDRYALCETTDKKFEMMKQTQQEQIKYLEQKTDKMEKLFDLKFLTQELKSIDEQIYRLEREFGTTPKDPNKRADLEKLKRDRERILAEMEQLRKK